MTAMADDTMRVARRVNGRLTMLERVPTGDAATPKLNKADQRAQAAAMMHRRLFDGATVAQLADEFGVERDTVARRLKLARQDGVPDEAREILIRDMLPASLAVLKEALASDINLATKVAIKLIELLKVAEIPTVSNEKEADDTLEIWRERIKVVRSSTGGAPQDVPESVRAIEGMVVHTLEGPAHPAADDSQGPGADEHEADLAGRGE